MLVKEAKIQEPLSKPLQTSTADYRDSKAYYVFRIALATTVGALTGAGVGFLVGGPVGLTLGFFIGAGIGYGAGVIITGKMDDSREDLLMDKKRKVIAPPLPPQASG